MDELLQAGESVTITALEGVHYVGVVLAVNASGIRVRTERGSTEEYVVPWAAIVDVLIVQ